MDVGTEENWTEGIPLEPAPLEGPEAPPRTPPTRTPVDGEPPFHTEFMELCAKYGIEDFFYVALSEDGKNMVPAWIINAAVDAVDYRPRAARLSFEVTGMLQHMEGSTWPLPSPATAA